MNTTTQRVIADVNVNKVMDWAISSEATKELVERSTTSANRPERLMKHHERGATMYKKVIGIYAISHEKTNSTYFGSSVCITGRINMHKRELRNGVHANAFLQSLYNKYGDELVFRVIELCERADLRTKEQGYIDSFEGRLVNADKVVCELAPAEVHSKRMKGAWKKRTPEQVKAMATKISNTLKRRYLENPKALKQAQDALAKGRASAKLKARKTSPEANEKRRQAALKQWANRDAKQRKAVGSKISKAMIDSSTPEQRSAAATKAAQSRKYC